MLIFRDAWHDLHKKASLKRKHTDARKFIEPILSVFFNMFYWSWKLETTQKKIINLELQFTGIPYNKCNNPGGLWGFRQVGFPQKWLHRTCRKLEWIPPERRNRPMIITEIRGPIASSSDGGRRQRRKEFLAANFHASLRTYIGNLQCKSCIKSNAWWHWMAKSA